VKNKRERERERERETGLLYLLFKESLKLLYAACFSSDFLVYSWTILLLRPTSKFHFTGMKLLWCLLKQDFTVVAVSRVEDTDY
jgi:hypothetical protein